MARKRKQEEYQVFNGGGVGYSQDALDALMRGQYDQLTGRDPKYRTSQDQLNQARSLPILKGMETPSSSVNNDWQSSLSRKNNVDTVGARQKYADRIGYEPMGTVVNNDENYVVKRDRYNKLMQNGRLANDIKTLAEVNYKNANRDATVSQEWADTYGAKNITGGYTKDQFIKMLGRRYDLTPKELEDMALTFHTDSVKAENENFGKSLEKFGEDHPVVGSLGSFVGTLGSGVEGLYNTAAGAISDDDRFLSNMFSTLKNSPREGARKNIKTQGGNNAYNVAMGLGDFGTAVVSGGLPFITGGNTANEIIQDAVKKGKDVRKSSVYGGTLGTARGIVDALTMGAGSTAVNAGKNFFTKAAIAGGKAGALGLGEQAFNELADALIMGNEGTYAEDVAQYMRQGLSEEEAGKRAMGNIVLRGGESALTRAALGAGISLVGSAAQGFKQSLRDLAYRIKMDRYVVDPDDPIFNEPIIDLDDLNEYYTRNENVLEGQTIPRLTGSVESTSALPGGNLPTLPDNIYPIQMPGTNGVINLPGATPPIQLPDLAARSLSKTAALKANDGVIRSKPVLPSMIGKSSNTPTSTGASAPQNNTRTMNESIGWTNPRTIKKLEGADLENVKTSVAKNKTRINALKNEIDILKNDKSNLYRGNLKKAVQKEIAAKEKQIKTLEKSNKELNQQMKGGLKPVIDMLTTDQKNLIYDTSGKHDSVFSKINFAVKFAGDTPEAKALAKQAQNAIREFVRTGSAQSVRDMSTALQTLDNMAKTVNATYTSSKGNQWNYDSAFGDQAEYLSNLQPVADIYNAEKAAARAARATQNVPQTAGASVQESGQPNNVVSLQDFRNNSRMNPTMDDANENLRYELLDAMENTDSIHDLHELQRRADEAQLFGVGDEILEKINSLKERFKYQAGDRVKYEVVTSSGYKQYKGTVRKMYPDHAVIDVEGMSDPVNLNLEDMAIMLQPDDSPISQAPLVTQESSPKPTQRNLPVPAGPNSVKETPMVIEPKSEPKAETPNNGYWLRVLGDDEFAVQESQKNGMSVDDYRRIAASNVPGAEVPPPSNVPPTNNVPPTDNPNNGENMRERGMSKHMRGEGKMSVDIPEEVKQDFIDNPDMYEQLSNKATSERALKIYNEHPEDREAIFRNMLTQFDPAALPLGNMIAKDYSAAGNHAMAAQIIRDMGERLTKAGQFSQASIINMLKNDPLSAQEYAQRSIDKLNAQGRKEFGKKWNDMSLTEEEMDAFNDIEPGDEEALADLYDQIGQRLGREYPSTVMEQLLEGRKIAMLFNVRTVSRNFFANPPTLGMRYIADRIEALGQNAVHLLDPTFEKTQSLRSGGTGRKIAKEFTKTDKYKALVNGTDEKHTVPDLKSEIVHHKQMYKGTAAEKFIDDWMGDVFNRVSDALYNSGKTKSNPHITTPLQELNSRLYKKDEVQSVLETIRNTTYKLLDVTDSPFVKENFVERLGSYLNAQGIKSIDDIPDDAIRVAWNEALKATYKDDSWMVKALKGIKGGIEKIPGIGKPLSQGLIPFLQAPGNIAARMVDYSPINLTKGIAQIIKGATKKDHDTIRKGIEAAAKGLTGSGLALLGMKLYKSGILTGDYSSDSKEKSFQQRNGFKPWSLHVGDKYFTFNWMQPFAQTIMSGIIIQQAIDNADDFDSDVLRHFGIEGSTAGKAIGAAYMSGKAAYNAWFDEAPLGDLTNLFAGSFFDRDIAQNTIDVGGDFASAMYPATLNAVAKTVDPIKRNTKDASNNFSTFVNEQIAKVPFLSKTLPVKYDTWGEEIKYADSKGEAAFQRFAFPGEYSSDSSDPLDVEIQRLFKETNDNRVFPFYAASKVGDKTLNNKESSEYQKDMGQRSKAFAKAFIASDRYEEMDDASRVDTLNQMYYVSKALTERDKFGKPLADSSPYKKYVQAYDEAGGGEKGIQAVVNYSETKTQMKEAGLTSSSKLGKEVLEASQKGDSKTVEKITETAKSIAKTYREIDGADGSEPNEGIKMDEVIAYANKNHLSEQQMNKTWSMYAPAGKQVPYLKKDGTWGKHSPKK